MPMARNKSTAPPLRRRPHSVVELGPWLSAQQMSLVKAFVVGDAGFLNRSYHTNHRPRRRTAFRLKAEELEKFAAAWAVEPVRCIQILNEAVARLSDSSRLERYLEATVDLEVLLDRACFPSSGERIYCGVPSYFMDGYTEMGTSSAEDALPFREKMRIKVSKPDLRAKLVEAKRIAVFSTAPTEDLLHRYYRAIRRDLGFEEARPRALSEATLSLATHFESAARVCRRLTITLQLYLQEGGIPSRPVRGDLRLFGLRGRHAWNLAFILGRAALIDPALADAHAPFIVTGASRSEAYRLAEMENRVYVPTPDAEQTYKIDVIEELSLDELLETEEPKPRSLGGRNVG